MRVESWEEAEDRASCGKSEQVQKRKEALGDRGAAWAHLGLEPSQSTHTRQGSALTRAHTRGHTLTKAWDALLKPGPALLSPLPPRSRPGGTHTEPWGVGVDAGGGGADPVGGSAQRPTTPGPLCPGYRTISVRKFMQVGGSSDGLAPPARPCFVPTLSPLASKGPGEPGG